MFFKYKVTWYCDYDGDEKLDCGLVYATDYGNAANKLLEDYGKDNVIDIYLQELEDENAINLEAIKFVFKDEI